MSTTSRARKAGLTTTDRLETAADETRIVCFGDSITGIYYHTGGYRAWPELLATTLRQTYPDAPIRVLNAGISGDTTTAALERMDRDVLIHRPHLVVIMFGMNDLGYGDVTPGMDAQLRTRFRSNVTRLIGACRASGAEALLVTPNSVYPEAAPARPPQRVAAFADLIRELGVEQVVPVVDVYREWERLRAETPRLWRLMMSETIHPSLVGHRVVADLVATAIAGRPVILAAIDPAGPYLRNTAAALAADKPVKLVVADTFQPRVTTALQRIAPGGPIDIVPWPLAASSLGEIEAWSRHVRSLVGRTLVVGSFSPTAAEAGDNEEAFMRRTAWVVCYSLAFGHREWDVVFISPALGTVELTPTQRQGADLMGQVVRAHDVPWLDAEELPESAGDGELERWFRQHLDASLSEGAQSSTSR